MVHEQHSPSLQTEALHSFSIRPLPLLLFQNCAFEKGSGINPEKTGGGGGGDEGDRGKLNK